MIVDDGENVLNSVLNIDPSFLGGVFVWLKSLSLGIFFSLKRSQALNKIISTDNVLDSMWTKDTLQSKRLSTSSYIYAWSPAGRKTLIPLWLICPVHNEANCLWMSWKRCCDKRNLLFIEWLHFGAFYLRGLWWQLKPWCGFCWDHWEIRWAWVLNSARLQCPLLYRPHVDEFHASVQCSCRPSLM